LKNSLCLGRETSAKNFDLSDGSRIDGRDAGRGRSTPVKLGETVFNEIFNRIGRQRESGAAPVS